MACHHNMPFALHTKNGQPLCAARSPINHIIMVEIPCKIPAFTGSLLPTRARPQPTDNPGKYKTPRRYAASPRPAERLKKPSAHKKNSPARAPGVPYLQYSMQSSGGLAPGKVSPGEAWRDRPLLKRRGPPSLLRRDLPQRRPPKAAYCIACIANTVCPGARAGEFLLGADGVLRLADRSGWIA